MIVIEIRIGREVSRQQPGELLDPVALATALRPRKSRPERWVWRLGRRGIAAAVASVLGVASLALVPGADAPVAATVQPVASNSPQFGLADGTVPHSGSDREIERMARDLTTAALERVRAREAAAGIGPISVSAHEPELELGAAVPHGLAEAPVSAMQPSAPFALGARQSRALELPAEDELTTRQRPRGRAVVQQSLAAVTAVADPIAEPVAEAETSPQARQVFASDVLGGPESTALATPRDPSGQIEPGVAAAADEPLLATTVHRGLNPGAELTEAAARAAGGTTESGTKPAAMPAPPAHFSISRDRSAETQDLLAALHERASRGDWSGVSDLLARLRAGLLAGQATDIVASDPTLATTLAKWDARVALQAGDAAAAVSVLEALTGHLDDEARALQAVAWLRTGAADRAVDTYRDLLLRRPDDARLWLGLGMALESTAADPAAVRFAYAQTMALAQEAGLRAAAEARLAPPQA